MDANYYYDDNNNINSTQIMLYAQDLRYQHIVELTTIYFGSPHDLLKFIIDVEKFANENEADVSNTIDGRRVNIVEQMGIKGFTIYEKDGSGYKVFTFKNWRKIKEALIEWAEEKNVSLE